MNEQEAKQILRNEQVLVEADPRSYAEIVHALGYCAGAKQIMCEACVKNSTEIT